MSERPTPAEVAFDEAATTLRREEIAAELADMPGLAYRSIGDHNAGPFLVANDGALIGEVFSEQGTVVHGWYAKKYGTESEPTGPHNTIRAAAASLLR